MSIIVVLIVGILLLLGMYSIRKYSFFRSQQEIKKRNDEILQSQVLEWCSGSFEVKKFKKDELFSPSRMKNGEVDLSGIEITVKDYCQSVPWFLRK